MKYIVKVVLMFANIMFLVNSSFATLKMPVLFSDNMVLQQKTEAPVWGTCKPGHRVKVKTGWDGKSYEVVSDRLGNWMVKVQTPEPGGPYKITVGAEDNITLNNVMIGEVWLCSGQSNMEMPLAGWGQVTNYEMEIANADHPNIRLFQVEKSTKLCPDNELKVMGNSWLVCGPTTVPEFSSTAYFFAVNLSKMLNNVPIGLIHASWGGTPAEAWTSARSLVQMPDFRDYLGELKKVPSDPVEQKKYLDREQELYNSQLINKDRGFQNGNAIWASPTLNDENWESMNAPQNWEEQSLKDFDGVVWYRKEVEVPADQMGKDMTLSLGTIDDNETTYFNGQQIGATQGWDHDRLYQIPAKLIKQGRNILAIRVFDSGGGGGIYGSANNVYLSNVDGYKIGLSGNWKYKVGFNLNEIVAPKVMPYQVQPTTLFNGMINPLVPYALRGAIWYQGEANEFRADQYSRLFPLMIHDWRSYLGVDFPFYFVQLANYKRREEMPVKAEWAELRQAQEKGLCLENTGMAVTIDIGNGENIHPKNKQEVGRRLALVAAQKTYGVGVVSDGPCFESFKILGPKIQVCYKSVGGGLVTREGGAVTGFAVAGVDKKFHWANAAIVGDAIVVSSPEVEFPVAVRYGWANNPDCNLYNKEGLPAIPFRTDAWDN